MGKGARECVGFREVGRFRKVESESKNNGEIKINVKAPPAKNGLEQGTLNI